MWSSHSGPGRVVALKGLLTAEDIGALHALAARLGGAAGSEYRVSDCSWKVVFLHTDGHFRTELPALRAKLEAAARRVDAAEGWGLALARGLAVRCVEYHRMELGASLPDTGHYDEGSLITLDCMLTQPGTDFEGAQLHTLAADGRTPEPHAFGRGDAMAFVSHKRHHVTPLARGTRQVLVVEFWDGEERTCPHRCECPWGGCRATKENIKAGRDVVNRMIRERGRTSMSPLLLRSPLGLPRPRATLSSPGPGQAAPNAFAWNEGVRPFDLFIRPLGITEASKAFVQSEGEWQAVADQMAALALLAPAVK
jgi:hypothetical protein